MVVYDIMRTNYYQTPPALLYCLLRLCVASVGAAARDPTLQPVDDIGSALMLLHGSAEWSARAAQDRMSWERIKARAAASASASASAAAASDSANTTTASASASASALDQSRTDLRHIRRERSAAHQALALRARIEHALRHKRVAGGDLTQCAAFRAIIDLHRPFVCGAGGDTSRLPPLPPLPLLMTPAAAPTTTASSSAAPTPLLAEPLDAERFEAAALTGAASASASASASAGASASASGAGAVVNPYFLPHPTSSFRSWLDQSRAASASAASAASDSASLQTTDSDSTSASASASASAASGEGRRTASAVLGAAASASASASASAPAPAPAPASDAPERWTLPQVTGLDLIHEVLRVLCLKQRYTASPPTLHRKQMVPAAAKAWS
jgi:hypothetical protein